MATPRRRPVDYGASASVADAATNINSLVDAKGKGGLQSTSHARSVAASDVVAPQTQRPPPALQPPSSAAAAAASRPPAAAGIARKPVARTNISVPIQLNNQTVSASSLHHAAPLQTASAAPLSKLTRSSTISGPNILRKAHTMQESLPDACASPTSSKNLLPHSSSASIEPSRHSRTSSQATMDAPSSPTLKRSTTLREMQRVARERVLQKTGGFREMPTSTATGSNASTINNTLDSASNINSDWLARLKFLQDEIETLKKDKLVLESKLAEQQQKPKPNTVASNSTPEDIDDAENGAQNEAGTDQKGEPDTPALLWKDICDITSSILEKISDFQNGDKGETSQKSADASECQPAVQLSDVQHLTPVASIPNGKDVARKNALKRSTTTVNAEKPPSPRKTSPARPVVAPASLPPAHASVPPSVVSVPAYSGSSAPPPVEKIKPTPEPVVLEPLPAASSPPTIQALPKSPPPPSLPPAAASPSSQISALPKSSPSAPPPVAAPSPVPIKEIEPDTLDFDLPATLPVLNSERKDVTDAMPGDLRSDILSLMDSFGF